MALRSLSLFSGIGGLDLGLAPWCRTVCYVERDAFAAAVLVARMADASLDLAPVWGDVASFDGRPWRGRVDLVAGGFPCQDLSSAGKRVGLSGSRSDLWSEYRRIVEEVEPSLVFVENVAALVGRGLDRVLCDLHALGYDAEWGVFSATEVGAPHRRQRLFLLAHAECERGEGHWVHERKRSIDLAADAKRRGSGSQAAVADAECEGLEGRTIQHARRQREALERGRGAVGDSDGEREREQDEEAQAFRERRQGARSHAVGAGPVADSVGRVLRHESRRRGRAGRRRPPFPPGPGQIDQWDGPQPAIRRSTHGSSRGLDVLETRSDRLRALGNAVVPAQAELAFRTLCERAFGRAPPEKEE